MSDLHITQVNLCFTGFFQNTLCSAFTITPPVLHILHICYSYQDKWAKPKNLQKSVHFQTGALYRKVHSLGLERVKVQFQWYFQRIFFHCLKTLWHWDVLTSAMMHFAWTLIVTILFKMCVQFSLGFFANFEKPFPPQMKICDIIHWQISFTVRNFIVKKEKKNLTHICNNHRPDFIPNRHEDRFGNTCGDKLGKMWLRRYMYIDYDQAVRVHSAD